MNWRLEAELYLWQGFITHNNATAWGLNRLQYHAIIRMAPQINNLREFSMAQSLLPSVYERTRTRSYADICISSGKLYRPHSVKGYRLAKYWARLCTPTPLHSLRNSQSYLHNVSTFPRFTVDYRSSTEATTRAVMFGNKTGSVKIMNGQNWLIIFCWLFKRK